uniref:WSC domain-containing protein n=1 Tax=Macrostomum lignano TaxID=282301 RepID=A0A1I8H2P9_9PLAT
DFTLHSAYNVTCKKGIGYLFSGANEANRLNLQCNFLGWKATFFIEGDGRPTSWQSSVQLNWTALLTIPACYAFNCPSPEFTGSAPTRKTDKAGADPAAYTSYGSNVTFTCPTPYGHKFADHADEADAVSLECTFSGWNVVYSIQSEGRVPKTFASSLLPRPNRPEIGPCDAVLCHNPIDWDPETQTMSLMTAGVNASNNLSVDTVLEVVCTNQSLEFYRFNDNNPPNKAVITCLPSSNWQVYLFAVGPGFNLRFNGPWWFVDSTIVLNPCRERICWSSYSRPGTQSALISAPPSSNRYEVVQDWSVEFKCLSGYRGVKFQLTVKNTCSVGLDYRKKLVKSWNKNKEFDDGSNICKYQNYYRGCFTMAEIDARLNGGDQILLPTSENTVDSCRGECYTRNYTLAAKNSTSCLCMLPNTTDVIANTNDNATEILPFVLATATREEKNFNCMTQCSDGEYCGGNNSFYSVFDSFDGCYRMAKIDVEKVVDNITMGLISSTACKAHCKMFPLAAYAVLRINQCTCLNGVLDTAMVAIPGPTTCNVSCPTTEDTCGGTADYYNVYALSTYLEKPKTCYEYNAKKNIFQPGKYLVYGNINETGTPDKPTAVYCYMIDGTACPAGWIGYQGSCYLLNFRPEELRSWNDSVEYCASQNAVLWAPDDLDYFFLYSKFLKIKAWSLAARIENQLPVLFGEAITSVYDMLLNSGKSFGKDNDNGDNRMYGARSPLVLLPWQPLNLPDRMFLHNRSDINMNYFNVLWRQMNTDKGNITELVNVTFENNDGTSCWLLFHGTGKSCYDFFSPSTLLNTSNGTLDTGLFNVAQKSSSPL